MPDDGIIKSLLFRTINGTEKKGKPNIEWLDDICDWTMLDIQQTLHMTQDRQLWRSHI